MRKKKPQLNDFDQALKQSYENISNIPVYCKICGSEIVWQCSPTGTEKPYDLYQQELLVEMHWECLSRIRGR